jgi:hypothetical protein
LQLQRKRKEIMTAEETMTTMGKKVETNPNQNQSLNQNQV